MRRPGVNQFNSLTPVAFKFSLIFSQLLAIPADFVSIIAKLLAIAGNLASGRVSAQIATQFTFVLTILLTVFA